jgi:hypothetical protein
MALDWGGKLDNDPDPYRTVWRNPRSGAEATTGTHSGVYRTVIAIRRSLDWAAEQPQVSMKKVVVYGGSWGGYYTMLVSGIDDRITDSVALTGAGGWKDSHSILADGINEFPPALRDEWLRTFDPISYAHHVKSDVTLVAHADDSFFWFHGVLKNFEAIPGKKRVIITPNSDHGICGHPDPIPTFPFTVSILKHHLNGVEFPVVAENSLKEDAKGSFSWQSIGPRIEKAYLYFSPGDVNYRASYWVEIPALLDGTTWKAELPEHLRNVMGSYYVTICASEDRDVSSMVHTRPGRDPQREVVGLWPGNALWDYAPGAIAWRPSIFHKFTTIQSPAPGVIRLLPGGDDKIIEARTDSTVLLGPGAAYYEGLQLTIDGEGSAGTLNIQLKDDAFSRNVPNIYQTTVSYSAGVSNITVPWKQFDGPEGAREAFSPFPFEALTLRGTRESGKPLTIKALTLAPLRQTMTQ